MVEQPLQGFLSEVGQLYTSRSSIFFNLFTWAKSVFLFAGFDEVRDAFLTNFQAYFRDVLVGISEQKLALPNYDDYLCLCPTALMEPLFTLAHMNKQRNIMLIVNLLLMPNGYVRQRTWTVLLTSTT